VEEIKKEFKAHALIGLILASFIMPVVLANADDAPNLENVPGEMIQKMEDSPVLKMYSGPLFCKRARGILEDAEDYGVFEGKAWKKLFQKKADT
jgi:hypothetical protein